MSAKTPVMNDKLSFDDAFKEARRLGASRFKWRGKYYHTMTADELIHQLNHVPKDERVVAWEDD